MIKDKAIKDLIPAVIQYPTWPAKTVYLPLTTTQFGQTLFPHLTQSDLNFEALCDVFTLWDLKLGKVSR
jgi:hypothetical protein